MPILFNEVAPKSAATIRHKKKPAKSMIYNARKKAKRLGLPFEIDYTNIVIPGHCPVLRLPLRINSTGKGRCHSQSPVLALREPEKGYTRANIVVISLRASRVIAGQTLAELQERLDSARIRGNREDTEKAASWLESGCPLFIETL